MAAINLLYPTMKVFQLTSTQVAAGAKIYTYEAGTTTNKLTYSDQALTTANANPVIADSNGEAQVWGADDGLYKIVINDSDDVLINSVDNVGSGGTATAVDGAYNLLVNGSWESNTGDGGVPDSWDLAITSPSTITIDDDDQIAGLYALEFVGGASGAGTATSQFFEVQAGKEIAVRFALKATLASVGQSVKFYWYTSAQLAASTASTTVYNTTTEAPTTWEEKIKTATPGSDVKYGKLEISGSTTAGTTNYDDMAVFNLESIFTVLGSDIIAAAELPVDIAGDYHDVTATAIPITAATAANPVVLTITANTLTNGDVITISGVAGMTELNGGSYIVASQATNTVELTGVDGTGFTAYTSGGEVTYDITSFEAVRVGTIKKIHFDSISVLNHDATNLILPGGKNITTAAGDEAEFIEYASGDWRCLSYELYQSPLTNGHDHAYEGVTEEWAVATVYRLLDRIQSTSADGIHYFECTTAGTSHASAEPTWPTFAGDSVEDNGVIWLAIDGRGTSLVKESLASDIAPWILLESISTDTTTTYPCDFEDIDVDNYDDFMIIYNNWHPTGTSTLQLRLGTGGATTTWDSSGYTGHTAQSASNATGYVGVQSTTSYLPLSTSIATTAGNYGSGIIKIRNNSGSLTPRILIESAVNNGSVIYTNRGVGHQTTTTQITALRIMGASTDTETIEAKLYGLRKI